MPDGSVLNKPPSRVALPSALLERDQWVAWRTQTLDYEPDTVLMDPETGRYAEPDEPDTWGGFDAAREFLLHGPARGVGFVLSSSDPFVGVVLEGARHHASGRLSPVARDVLTRVASYAEIDPTGDGLRLVAEGDLPGSGGRLHGGPVELCDRERCVLVTGCRLETAPNGIEPCQRGLRRVAAAYVDGDLGRVTASRPASPPAAATLPDRVLVERALNGRSSERFGPLWGGDTGNYPGRDAAELALCRLLAFWTGADHARMDRLFRRSGLMREEWDQVQPGEELSHGATLIQRAVSEVEEVYSPATDDPDSEEPIDGTVAPATELAADVTDSGRSPEVKATRTPTLVSESADALGPNPPGVAPGRNSRRELIAVLQEETEHYRELFLAEQQRRQELEARIEELTDEDDTTGPFERLRGLFASEP